MRGTQIHLYVFCMCLIFTKALKNPLLSGLNDILAGVAGLEPTLTVLETVALPLNYTPVFALTNNNTVLYQFQHVFVIMLQEVYYENNNG